MAIEFDPSEFNSSFIKSNSSDEILFADENICGEGASCRVYVQRLGGLRVAIKRLRSELLNTSVYIESYRKEFEIGQRLKHDALPVYRDFRADSNEVCILMDYVDGITLDNFLKTEDGCDYFSKTANVERFLLQLLDAVCYLHRSGVIHCDLKPANIMLRHSDRNVMLLDLDKAYCDTFDFTHGGSKGISSPLPDGSKPTASKDFEAIGNLIDWIESRVAKFPRRRFGRFRRQCRRAENSDRLTSALKPRNRSKGVFVAVLISCLLCVIVYSINRRQGTRVVEEPTEKDARERIDTIANEAVTEVAEEKDLNSTVPSKPATGADFDEQMSRYIVEAQSALEIVESGSASDTELREIMNDLFNDYHDRYMTLLADYKSHNPDMAEIDVEIAMARQAERSRASKLRTELSKAIADTLLARHPDTIEPSRF